ncbi:MAG TPA: serine hydrolase domain-containing protein [Amycolatopsis sp.]|nr:serine hydrolase domain-containing protein [Amycolatopsis sp.]
MAANLPVAGVRPRAERRSHPAVDEELRRLVEAGETGIQVAAVVDGRLRIDAWAGRTSEGGGLVDGETLFPVFSVSKAVTATALHVQAERGLVEYDAPLARYWPEYGAHGKDGITVGHVLSHRAGVPQMPDGVSPEIICDWPEMTRRLADLEPLFPAGARNTYLSMTFGWLLGEVVRRTDPRRRPFGRFVREEVCAPLGMHDFYLGVPESEQSRVATLTFPERPPCPPAGSLVRRAVPPAVGLDPDVFNRPEVRRACVPAVGGIGNARSVARLFAMLAGGGSLNGTRLLGERRVLSFLEPRPDHLAVDEVYGKPFPVGVGGYWVTAPGVLDTAGREHRVLAHTGAGGSIAWADLDTGVAVAVCHNRMVGATPEPLFARLADAVRLAVT